MTASTFPSIVPTTNDGLIDWTAVQTMPASQREAVLTAVTGINPETTADRHDVTVVVDMNDPAMGALVSERAYSAPADAGLMHAPSLKGVLSDASHTVSTVGEALVLSALMHGDVWTSARTREASPRVKMATLAREVAGADDSTTVRAVRRTLDAVVDSLAGSLADAVDATEAPARRMVAARAALNVSGDTLARAVPVVVAGGRGDASALLSVSDRTTRRERAASREVAREVAPERFPGRTAPEAPAEAPVDTATLPAHIAAAWLTEACARAMASRFRTMRAIVERDAGRERSARAATGNGTRTAPTARASRAPRVSAAAAVPTTGRARLASLRRR